VARRAREPAALQKSSARRAKPETKDDAVIESPGSSAPSHIRAKCFRAQYTRVLISRSRRYLEPVGGSHVESGRKGRKKRGRRKKERHGGISHDDDDDEKREKLYMSRRKGARRLISCL